MTASINFQSVSPSFPCKNINATLNYYKDVLAFRETFVNRDDNGSDPVYAIVSRGNVQVHLFPERDGQEAGHGGSHFLITNAEEYFDSLEKSGVTIVYKDFESGMYNLKTFTIKDVDGNFLTFAEEI